MSKITCRSVHAHYPGFELGPLDLDIPAGIICLVGANGAGKSTFFRILTGLERRRQGVVLLDGATLRGRDIGYLPQDLSFPRRATCEQYLTHIAWLHAVPASLRAGRVTATLVRVGLSERAGSRISTLSGGMRRRLGIAHAIIHAPSVLVLDEPTVGLDPLQRVAMREAVLATSADRPTIVSTHLVDDIAALAEQVVVLRQGQVVFTGSVEQLELMAEDDAPGSSPLERAVATLISEQAPVGTSPAAPA